MFLHEDKLDKTFHDQRLTPQKKLQYLGEQASDKPVDLETVIDEQLQTNSNLVPSSSTLEMQLNFFLTRTYAVQYAGRKPCFGGTNLLFFSFESSSILLFKNLQEDLAASPCILK